MSYPPYLVDRTPETVKKADPLLTIGDTIVFGRAEHVIDAIGPYVPGANADLSLMGGDWQNWTVAYSGPQFGMTLTPSGHTTVTAPRTPCPVCGRAIPYFPGDEHTGRPDILTNHRMAQPYTGLDRCATVEEGWRNFHQLIRAYDQAQRDRTFRKLAQQSKN